MKNNANVRELFENALTNGNISINGTTVTAEIHSFEEITSKGMLNYMRCAYVILSY